MSSTTSHNSTTILIRSGIGGAGNYRQTKASQIITRAVQPIAPKTTGHFSSGIGGAGNSHSMSETTRISHEEFLRRERVRQYATPTNYHLGIGGAGNTRTTSSTASSSSSTLSSSSQRTSSVKTNKSVVSKLKNSVLESWHRRNERVSLYDAWNRKLPTYPSSTNSETNIYSLEKVISHASTNTLVSTAEKPTQWTKIEA